MTDTGDVKVPVLRHWPHITESLASPSPAIRRPFERLPARPVRRWGKLMHGVRALPKAASAGPDVDADGDVDVDGDGDGDENPFTSPFTFTSTPPGLTSFVTCD